MEDFQSNSNKGLLWNLLFEGGAFYNILESKIDTVKKGLDNCVDIIEANKVPSDTLTILNKKVVELMIKELETFRNEPPKNPPKNPNTLITAEDLSNERQTVFTHNLDKRQSDFTKLIETHKPPEIDFRDKDTNEDSDLDTALADTLARRDYELKTAYESQSQIKKNEWIPNKAKQITIDNDTPVENNSIQHIVKKVQFADESATVATNFLSKLKKYETGETPDQEVRARHHQNISPVRDVGAGQGVDIVEQITEILTRISKIEINQKKILALLTA